MGWEIGFDDNWNRDIGYGVPAECDHPRCKKTIDRGLSYVCGGEPYGGDKGCGLYFCQKHLAYPFQRCPKCARYDHKPYKPKPDLKIWTDFKMVDPSWAEWRKEQQEAKSNG